MTAYSDKEIITLITKYRNTPLRECCITGRSLKSLYEKTRRLGIIKMKRWTADEIDILLNNQPTEASRMLNRSKSACIVKKHRLIHVRLM